MMYSCVDHPGVSRTVQVTHGPQLPQSAGLLRHRCASGSSGSVPDCPGYQGVQDYSDTSIPGWWIVRDTSVPDCLGYPGVQDYSDTSIPGWWTVRECPGMSRLPWSTGLLRHKYTRVVDRPGVSRNVQVTREYRITQTQVYQGGGPSGSVPYCPDYHRVRDYSDTSIPGWWTVRECPGLSRLPGSMGLLRHRCARGGGPFRSVLDYPSIQGVW